MLFMHESSYKQSANKTDFDSLQNVVDSLKTLIGKRGSSTLGLHLLHIYTNMIKTCGLAFAAHIYILIKNAGKCSACICKYK